MKPKLLFIAQYSLFILIILTGQIVPKQLPFLALFLVGLAFIILPLMSKNSKKKNVFYSIATSIQHPFYTAMLLTTLALVLDLYTYERLILWIVLFVIILMRLQVTTKKRKGAKSSKTAPAYRLIPFIY